MPIQVYPLKVAAVFATMNRREVAIECLRLLSLQSRQVEMLFIVDNASIDGTSSALKEASKNSSFPVEVLALNENLGNAGGVGTAMERAFATGHDAVWILDDDSWPEADALEKLLTKIPTGADVVSSIVLGPKGQPLDPSLLSWPLQVLRVEDKSGRNRWVTLQQREELPATGWHRVRRAWLGSLITRAVYETVGPVEGALFLRGEDEDYPRRIENAGFEVWLSLDSVLRHPVLGELGRLKLFGREILLENGLSGDKLYFRLRNMVWMMKRDRGLLAAAILALGYSILILQDDPALLKTWWIAIRDGWRGRMGKRPPQPSK